MEDLESRQLLAVAAVLNAGRLTVTGTPATDVVYFEPYLDNAAGNGVRVFDTYPTQDAVPIAAFDSAVLRSIVVDVKGGNDRVELAAGVRLFKPGHEETPIPVSLFGNGGTDIMYDRRDDRGPGEPTRTLIDGGLGPDELGGGTTIVGGRGNDTLYGLFTGSRNELLIGGDGNDTVLAYGGADTVRGGAGQDWIDGGRGNDRLFGDSGRDTLIGRVGDDTIYGDTDPLGGDDTPQPAPTPAPLPGDRDVLDGGTGDDALFGQGGDDQLFGSDGRDTLTGGPGSDRLHGQCGVDHIEAAGDATRDYLYDNADLDDIVSVDGDDVFV